MNCQPRPDRCPEVLYQMLHLTSSPAPERDETVPEASQSPLRVGPSGILSPSCDSTTFLVPMCKWGQAAFSPFHIAAGCSALHLWAWSLEQWALGSKGETLGCSCPLPALQQILICLGSGPFCKLRRETRIITPNTIH